MITLSEIKDVNKLVIKNSATIELERRKGFVNILLQGNPNLYRAWVERNNKIVIDISGESTEYNLDTETPDYIEIVKNQSDNKYYINFVGSITGDGNLVSDDITFSQEGDNTRLTIKSSKFVSTSKIKSGTPDYLYVNVDEGGNVRVGLTQNVIDSLNSNAKIKAVTITTDFRAATQEDVDEYGKCYNRTARLVENIVVGDYYNILEISASYSEISDYDVVVVKDSDGCIVANSYRFTDSFYNLYLSEDTENIIQSVYSLSANKNLRLYTIERFN